MPASSSRSLKNATDRQARPLVLMQACQALHAWRGSVAGARLRVAVNISSRHLEHGDLVQTWRGRWRLPGSSR